MRIELITAPYDSGRRGERMGAGPEYLIRCGLIEKIETAGLHVTPHVLETPPDIWPTEVQSTFALARSLAVKVRGAVESGAFPLVLSGNCGPAALGSVAGLGNPSAVFWFDSHGDFNTPETTGSGFVDGMALATLTGRCWTRLAASVPGFAPYPESSVVLLGARDLDAPEAAALRDSAVTRIVAGDLAGRLVQILERLRQQVQPVYLHIDLDVLDPREGRANGFAAPGGLSLHQLQWAVRSISEAVPVGAAALTAYDPGVDRTDRIADAARHVIITLLESVARGR